MIPAVMSSSNGRTLFSTLWWAEITKRDDFWRHFEIYVARTTINRRLRSPLDSKHVRVVTEFQTKRRRLPSLRPTPEAEDEMSDLEDDDEDLEESTLTEETTTPTKPSIEVVVPRYSSISTDHPSVAGKSIPEPVTATDSVEQPSSTHSFVTLPVALPISEPAPAPATITTPPYQLSMESPSLKRKYDEFMAGDETHPNTPRINLEPEAKIIKTDADAVSLSDANDEIMAEDDMLSNMPEMKLGPKAKTIKTDVDAISWPDAQDEEMKPISPFFGPTPTYSSISFIMTPNDTFTTMKNESWPVTPSAPITPPFPAPAAPKRTIKLEADSEEYLEFQKFRQLRESLLVRSPTLGPDLKVSAGDGMEEEEVKWKRVKLE